MADVYIGRHTTLDRAVAVKILHSHMTADPDLRRRFEDEAKAVSALRHPNIVQVLDFDVVDQRPYIIMELLEGMSLGQFLRELHSIGHTLPLETVARLVSGIAAALEYAHQRGIVHRDVKPANIVLRKGRAPLRADLPLGEDVQPVLTDFGVARIASASTRTASGTVLGTPAYMSPEQVQGIVVDARSDIYSLGVILYEMLAGRLPFDPETDTPASILYKHVHEDPPKLPNIPDRVQAVLDRALAKDKETRYQKVGAFARDLQFAVSNPGPATPTGLDPDTALPSMPSAVTAVSTAPAASESGSPPAVTPAPTPTVSSGRGGLGGIALVGAFALGAVVLAGGVFLGVNILRSLSGAAEPTNVPQATAVVAGPAPQTARPSDTTATPGVAAVPTADVSAPVGSILIGDQSLTGVLVDIAPPSEGMQYHAWLMGTGLEPLHLNPVGKVEFSNGQLTIEYQLVEESSLFATYDRLVVSEQPEGSDQLGEDQIRFEGALDPSLDERVAQFGEVYRNTAVLGELLTLLPRQATHFQSHANLAINEINQSNLSGAKLHSEHTINIAEGRAGEFFFDWDGNGAAENPGDDVGLLNYLQYLKSAAEGFGVSQQLAGRVDDLPNQVAAEASRLIDASLAVRDAARQIAGADEIGLVNDLGLADQLATANAIRTDIEALVANAQSIQLVFSFTMFRVASP